MANLSENPEWTTVTRIEPTTVALGGDENNSPNLQLKQLVDRTAWLRTSTTTDSLILIDDVVTVSSVVLTQVTGNVLTNDIGDTLTVVKSFYNGVEKTLGVLQEIKYGNLILNADGSFSYTIINNQLTTDFNLLPLNSTEDIVIQYVAQDVYGKKAVGKLTLRITQTIDLPPVLISALPDQDAMEGDEPKIISLLGVFADPEGKPMTYSVTNTNPGKVTTTLIGSTLTLYFPLWVSDFSNVTANITVTATDANGGSTSDTFTVTVAGLDELFTLEYYEFVYNLGDLSGTGNIYVTASERDTILADVDLNNTFTLQNSGNPVFTVIEQAQLIPASALANQKIVPVYRFRRTGVLGSYLYAIEPEASLVRANPDFVDEGFAFYCFAQGQGRQTIFKRYQYTFDVPIGHYVYSLGIDTPSATLTEFEGTVGEVKVL